MLGHSFPTRRSSDLLATDVEVLKARGGTARPLSDEDLRRKYDECCQWGGLPTERSGQVFDALHDLAAVDDMGSITALLTSDGGD